MEEKKQKYTTMRRAGFFIVVIILALALFTYINSSGWQADKGLYSLLTGIDAALTGMVGIIAFVRYYSRRNDTLLFIATAFTSIALVDIVQLLIWTETLTIAKNSTEIALEWSWLASQCVFGVLMFLSWMTLRLEKYIGQRARMSENVLYFFVGTLTIAILIFFVFVQLPAIPGSGTWGLNRPWELVPALLFAITAVAFIWRDGWKNNFSEFYLCVSMILMCLTHVLFMSQSGSHYDSLFYGALILKQASTIAVIIGSLGSMYHLFRQAEESEDQLVQQNIVLSSTKEELKAALDDTQKKEHVLAEKLRDIQTAQAKDEAMLESIGDGLVVTDDDTRVIRVNPGFEKMLGWNASEVSGKPITAVMPMLDDRGKLVPYEKRAHPVALFTGEKISSSMKYSYQRKDQSSFPVSITVTPIFIGEKIIGAIEIFRDITREKEMDEQKSSFVSVASHQLRTPLTTINWYLELILGGDAGKINTNQREYLQEVYHGSKRLVVLVNDLLNVSRIESGRMKIDPKPTDVMALIRDIVKEVFPLTKGTQCLVKIDNASQTLSPVSLDQNLFRQVVHNLLTNAIRYSPQNRKTEVVVHVSKKNVTKKTKHPHLNAGQYIVVSIEDHGIGIPKDAQPHLFEKFYRAENALHAAPEGSGLGLYLVKTVVDASDGKIWFETAEGKGTTFSIAFPTKGMKKREGEKGLAQYD
jgi:PAS domain S-box-containing protein